VIIPLYNEYDNISTYPSILFPEIERISQLYNEKMEVIFIDDGSTDATKGELLKLSAVYPDIIILHHEKNRGMGAAIKTGISNARGEHIITMDSDLTFRPQDIQKLISAFQKADADCISGSPFIESGLLDEVEPQRLWLSTIVNRMYRVLLSSNISCVSPIFRLYKKKSLEDIDIESDNFEINAEIISKFILSGKKVIEVPVALHKRQFGESKINILREVKNNIGIMAKIVKVRLFRLKW